MIHRIYTDRSRIELAQRCMRARWWEYHAAGAGVVPSRVSLPLAVGASVHVGLATLLQRFIGLDDMSIVTHRATPGIQADLEEQAVAAALMDFQGYVDCGLELDASERAALEKMSQPEYLEQLAASLGTTVEEAGLEAITVRQQRAASEYELWLAQEQSALVEAMVRAYARRRLRPLLEQYEVLEVEREGSWKLSEWSDPEGLTTCADTDPLNDCKCGGRRGRSDCMYEGDKSELRFMSRPDALLRDRASNQLVILSYKTTGQWDQRKEKDAMRDMQGLSEGVEVERRLAGWWNLLKSFPDDAWVEGSPFTFQAVRAGRLSSGQELESKGKKEVISASMCAYLRLLPAPPRILAIRYEYLLKGERWKDKDLTARLGVEVRSQRSHLIRQYVAHSTPKKGTAEYALGDVCWSWDYVKDGGEAGSLAWQNWRSQSVWDQRTGGVKAWIDQLDTAAEAMSGEDSTVGMEPRRLGWKCDGQRMGYTATHPLDAVFVPPMVVYRNDDELRDWVEQVEAQERRIVEAVSEVEAIADAAGGGNCDEGERRHLLNVHFPQTRRACEYPGTCAFVKLCWGGEDIRQDPLRGGYRRREPNHPQEKGRGQGPGQGPGQGQ